MILRYRRGGVPTELKKTVHKFNMQIARCVFLCHDSVKMQRSSSRDKNLNERKH
jgi:hypothetical protein